MKSRVSAPMPNETCLDRSGLGGIPLLAGVDRQILQRINEIIRDLRRNPFRGIGKPEPLKFALAGWWSRRITGEHRIVYRVNGQGDAQQLEIASCRYHY